MGSLPGALVGAAVWLLLPSVITGMASQMGDSTGLLRSAFVDHKPQLVQAIFGSLVVVLLIFAPWGIAGMASRIKARMSAMWDKS
jgi:ABC-type branched-subunit amino acid transport system permease subunit